MRRRKKRNKFSLLKNIKGLKRIKNKINYWITGLVLLLISFVINNGNIDGINWKTVFNNTKISDNISGVSSEFDMSVHFLDVGKADCAYIKCKDKNILIDAADKEPTSVVVEYLKKQDVSDLDLVVVSHQHRDHIGQMAEVINEFQVKRFMEPDTPDKIIPTTATYKKMLKALKNKNVKSELIKAPKDFDIGNMHIEILGPISDNDNINSNSIVMKITYKDVSFLFTGDAEKAEETEIMDSGYDVNSTVLKVGHHGSKTSSSERFLEEVNPEYAIISVGPDRSNLPKEETLNKLGKVCSNIYRTDLCGNIIIHTDGKNIKVETEK